MNKHAKMKLFTLIVFLFLLSANIFAQENTVTINVNRASLREVFNVIEKQTTYRFSYRDAAVDTLQNITISKTNVTVPIILDLALKGRELEYKIVSSKSIVISSQKKTGINAPTKRITGLVTDELGEPIIGAAVKITGMSVGSITDIDGKFSLDVSPGSTIEITYIGYRSEKLTIASSYDL